MHTQKNIFAVPNAGGVATLGLLTAIRLVLGRLSIGNNFIQFNFVFIATFLIAMWFGPFWAGAISGFADIFTTLISGAIYLPGFTLSAVLVGVIYGLFFYRHQPTLKTVIIAQLLVVIFVDLVLNTAWIVILNHVPVASIIGLRLVKELITGTIQIILLYLVSRSTTIDTLGRKLRK